MMSKMINGKPNPPASKAIVGSLPVVYLNGIDPQRVPASKYIKKV